MSATGQVAVQSDYMSFSLEWYPTSYEAAKARVEEWRGRSREFRRTLSNIIDSRGGKLECPAPDDDPHGVYSVVMNHEGFPEIRKSPVYRFQSEE